jgi:hypothetical protein
MMMSSTFPGLTGEREERGGEEMLVLRRIVLSKNKKI